MPVLHRQPGRGPASRVKAAMGVKQPKTEDEVSPHGAIFTALYQLPKHGSVLLYSTTAPKYYSSGWLTYWQYVICYQCYVTEPRVLHYVLYTRTYSTSVMLLHQYHCSGTDAGEPNASTYRGVKRTLRDYWKL